MADIILTGFHAVEEKVRACREDKELASKITVFYSKPGPRIKKILEQAKLFSVTARQTDDSALDDMVKTLSVAEQDHRGIVAVVTGQNVKPENIVDFDRWLENTCQPGKKKTVVVLDCVTDPHNVGAIIRSADQFGADLVLLPERHSANRVADNDIIARSSAGASAWVPVSIVTNLVRAVGQLKEKGYWIYGADAGGVDVTSIEFAEKTVLVMGSEGSGISRLLKQQCDSVVSIPTCGKIDSLNVSVATGILLYERNCS